MHLKKKQKDMNEKFGTPFSFLFETAEILPFQELSDAFGPSLRPELGALVVSVARYVELGWLYFGGWKGINRKNLKFFK